MVVLLDVYGRFSSISSIGSSSSCGCGSRSSVVVAVLAAPCFKSVRLEQIT